MHVKETAFRPPTTGNYTYPSFCVSKTSRLRTNIIYYTVFSCFYFFFFYPKSDLLLHRNRQQLFCFLKRRTGEI